MRYALLVAGLLFPAFARGELPDAWHGDWKGTLKLLAPKEMTVPMELRIHPKEGGVYEFALVYGEGDKKQVRPHELKPVKDKPGQFIIDEKNGIELQARLVGDTIHCTFTAGDLLLDTRHRLKGDALLFEITTTDLKQAKATGPESAKVKTTPVVGVQMAELKRAK